MLSHGDRFKIARKQKELLGDNKMEDLPLVLQQKSIILSELAARVVQAPNWWGDDGSTLMDDNLLISIFEAAVEVENEEVKKLLGEGETAKKELEKIVENANKSDVVEKK